VSDQEFCGRWLIAHRVKTNGGDFVVLSLHLLMAVESLLRSLHKMKSRQREGAAMTVLIRLEQITALAPCSRLSYSDAFSAGQPLFDLYGISGTPLRIAHFMAQVLHESAALTLQYENLNYSAQRLPVVWPSRFLPHGPLDPAQYAHNPQKLANAVYGGRMGNDGPDDGYLYRGRGLLQLTGKLNYATVTANLRSKLPEVPDFTENPDAVMAASWCLAVAASTWHAMECNALADADRLADITKRINGGTQGVPACRTWLLRTKRSWPQR
jgi:putative chitinase